MKRQYSYHRGIVQIVPMIVLAVLAITTFVVTGVVEKQQQDIRSNAASIVGKCNKTSTSTLCTNVQCTGTTEKTCTDGNTEAKCCSWTGPKISVTPTKKPLPKATCNGSCRDDDCSAYTNSCPGIGTCSNSSAHCCVPCPSATLKPTNTPTKRPPTATATKQPTATPTKKPPAQLS